MKRFKSIALSIFVANTFINFGSEPTAVELYARRSFVPFLFTAQLTKTNSFLIQTSTDLLNWRHGISVYARVTSFQLCDRPSVLRPAPTAQFYSVSGPAQPISGMRDNWKNLGARLYRFRFLKHCACLPNSGGVIATVTVQDGAVVAVENTTNENGDPVLNPDPRQFLSIEQLFDALLDHTETGFLADVVAAQFDETYFFPQWISWDLSVTRADDEEEYFVSDLEILQ